MIEVEKIRKTFDATVAVDEVSFSVRSGEVFGFLGPNGAGKTTTINILCTLLKPTSGKAVLNGYDVVAFPHEVRSSIGIVFQDPSLDERLTAKENLNFHALVYNIPRELREKRIKTVLELVELWPRRDDVVRNFSGGMKRRLEIGRGLLHFPKVLFLDEPTLGLDPQTRHHIWEYVHGLRVRENITVFLTTHYMDEAENCDRVAVIDQGKIIAVDTPDKLKRSIGGDTIALKTENNANAAGEIKNIFGKDSLEHDNTLYLETVDGEEFLPELIGRLSTPVLSVSVSRPTLEDVFLRLTGRMIRDESGSAKESIRSHVRAIRRRR